MSIDDFLGKRLTVEEDTGKVLAVDDTPIAEFDKPKFDDMMLGRGPRKELQE